MRANLTQAAIGFRAHSGWAVAVAVAGSPAEPRVLERRRIETADAAIPGSKQPYHAAEGLSLGKAEALIGRCRESSLRLARDGVSAAVAALAGQGHKVVAGGILLASGRPLPGLAAVLASHALIHTAEGELFREVLVRAGEHCGLPVTRVKEREIWEKGAAVFGLAAAELQRQIDGLGRALGPPWRQDEKLASLAAWIALAESS